MRSLNVGRKVSQVVMFNFMLLLSSLAQAESLTLEQVLQRVMDHYPSIKTAAIQVERAQQESKKVGSQLGWQLSAQGGVSRDVSLLGTPTDTVNVAGGLSRKLESGGTFGFDADVTYSDSETTFSPTLPNPATNTSIDLTYRQPLAKGAGNPLYEEGLANAKAGVMVSDAERKLVYDQLASQIIDLFMSAATTRATIVNLERAIERSKRLRAFIKKRESLGLSEDKDILQVEAQLNSQRAEYRGLQMLWQQQQISLNRLMGRDWDAAFEPVFIKTVNISEKDFKTLFPEASAYSPQISAIDARILLADSALRSRRDERENNLDVVLFAGSRTQSGDSANGDVDLSDVVGGVRLEFNQTVDKSGVDAELYQAQLDRSTALQDKRQAIEDLQYDLSSLLAELKVGSDALNAYRRSVKSEKAKLDEAHERYRTGRTDTDQLIQFENELSGAELSLVQQQIEMARRFRRLNLLNGDLWRSIHIPEFEFGKEGDGS